MRARALILIVAALPLAARTEVLGDDASARLRATWEWYGADLRGRARLFEAARRERDRYAIGAPRPVAALAAVAGSSFINLGPTRADFEINGDRYQEIDSGRIRQIVPHPTDPDILYVATSGGGLWKTYGARPPGVVWQPLTDAIGSTSIGTVAMDPANPDILFLGFGDPFDVQQPGITRSLDGGGTWAPPKPLVATYPAAGGAIQLTAGSVTDIKVDPRSSLVVLAATDVGLFRSVDGGDSFSQVSLSSGSAQAFYMWSLAYAGNDVWLATSQVADLTAPPTPLGGGGLGLWRSTDDGATWTYSTAALPGGDAAAGLGGRGTLATAPSTLEDPASARVYLLAARNDGSAQMDLFRSDDGGRSFQSLHVDASRAPVNPNSNQKTLDVLGGQAWYNQALAVDPGNPDTVFIGGQYSMIRSMDAGRTWSVISNWLPNNSQNDFINLAYVHADLHAFAIGPDGTFLAGSDGGISYSHDALQNPAGSVNFNSAPNEGLVTHLAYSVACAPESWTTLPDFVIGGMQDNGTRLRSGATTTFDQVLGGDGIGVAVGGSTHRDSTLQRDVPDILLASAPGRLFLSRDGAQNFDPYTSGLGLLPFLVRVARDGAAGDVFLTFTGQPTGFFRWSAAAGETAWTNVSGVLHWQDPPQDVPGFNTPDGTVISLRNLAAHPTQPGVWAAVSNRFSYMTSDGGAHWLVGLQPKPPGQSGGASLLSSVAFDPRDASGSTYYVTSLATFLIDAQNHYSDPPPGFGHLFRTRNGGASWESVGAQDVTSGGLPDVGADVIKVDPNDPATLYAGTVIGLYRSTDSGATWSRFGAGTLPLVEVKDLCISPASRRLTVATYGRGFWQIDTAAGASPAGVRGVGDTNFDGRIDGEDLIDLADGFNSTQSSALYRWQADLVGTSNGIDQNDLSALLAKFGGPP